jgi:pimeloyl-ACP methyl ester carboxylesterase
LCYCWFVGLARIGNIFELHQVPTIVKISIKLVAILCLIMPILAIGWNRWGSNKFQQLPLTVAAAGNSNILRGQYYEASIPPTTADAYKSADFRMWIPQDVRTIRGVIVKQHGCSDSSAANALDYANDYQWQALAVKHQFALLGNKFLMGKKPCESWAMINNGSSAAFLKALHAIAGQSQHPEIDRVPWVLWGHSGGADWSTQMLQEYPERTIAVIAARGGAFALLGSNPTLAKTPMMFALGGQDRALVRETHDLPIQAFLRHRKLNAPWALAIAANTGHESGDTRLLAIPYFDEIIRLRLLANDPNLHSIERARGWLGDPKTHKIAPADRFEGDYLAAAWLPNQETANKWQEYVTNGKIVPTRTPAAPTDLKVTKINDKEILLTWHFTPDLENGLPSFHIYRNNLLIKTFQQPGHDSGDVTDAPNIALEFRDRDYVANSQYRVTAFNAVGESTNK